MKQLRSLLLDPRCWILIFFIAGLGNIQLPPIDKHDWRQTLTLSIAQNFLEHPNPLYPRMDIGGQSSGIMACEFPAFNFLLAGLFKVFGPHHWLGRLLNWTVSCTGLWFFYLLAKRALTVRAAQFAMLALMSSVVFEYARKSMPDTFALFTTLAGVWFLWTYLQNRSVGYLFAGSALCGMGILSKIPFVLLLSFLIIPVWDQQYPLELKKKVLAALFVAMAGVGSWYFYWMPHLLKQFGNQLIWPVSLQEGWKIVVEEHGQDSWKMLTDAPFHNRLPFLVAWMGLGMVWAGSKAPLKWFAFTYATLFFMFTLKTGIVFPTHDYYIIPLVPLLSIAFGQWSDQLKIPEYLKYLLVAAILSAGFWANKKLELPQAGNRAYLMKLPAIMDRYTLPDEKVMVNNGMFNPTMMYWARRKGWTVNTDVPGKSDWIPDFKKQGLKYILLDRHLSEEALPYRLLFEDPDFRLYAL